MSESISNKLAKERGWPGFHVTVEDAEIYVERHGSGEPVICLHNFSANSRERFTPLLPFLADRYECFLVDLRGHGRSTDRSAAWSHEQSAQDIIRVIQALGFSSVRVLATSSGAMAMLRVARMAPELVATMVLDSGTYRIPVEARKWYKEPKSLSPRLRAMYEVANEAIGVEQGMKLAQTFYDFRLPECDINQPIENLREIETPTLLIAGDRDRFFPVEIHMEMKRAIRRSELWIMPQTGHIVMEFFPELVALKAREFFARS